QPVAESRPEIGLDRGITGVPRDHGGKNVWSRAANLASQKMVLDGAPRAPVKASACVLREQRRDGQALSHLPPPVPSLRLVPATPGARSASAWRSRRWP